MEQAAGRQLNAMLDHTLTAFAVVVAVWAFWRQYIKQQESIAAAGVVVVLTLTEGQGDQGQVKRLRPQLFGSSSS